MVEATAPTGSDEQRGRILDAALQLVARWGVAKTSIADLAKEAGSSRATIYRLFPGGKQHLFIALAHRELALAVTEVRAAFRLGDDLADALTRALVVAARLVEDHDAARYVLVNEPDLVLPYLGFGRVDAMHRLAVDVFTATAATRVDPARAPWLVEWTVRAFVSYMTTPDPDHDLTDIDQTRSLVERFITPAFTNDLLDHPLSA